MDFAIDFGLFAIIIIAIMAFMGVIWTKVAESFGGNKGKEALDHTQSTKEGWKPIRRKKA